MDPGATRVHAGVTARPEAEERALRLRSGVTTPATAGMGMIKEPDGGPGEGLLAGELVPVRGGADLIYVEAQVLRPGDSLGDEGEISGRSPSMDCVLNGPRTCAAA